MICIQLKKCLCVKTTLWRIDSAAVWERKHHFNFVFLPGAESFYVLACVPSELYVL